MSEDEELPAVYRSLSVTGLEAMRARYKKRLAATRSPWMRDFLKTRVRFIEYELERRREAENA